MDGRTTVAPGDVIADRYRLDAPIGQGGMGTIWRATHAKLGHGLAVKLLSRKELTEELASRFLREARATAAIKHRNIVEVVDFGTHEGAPYLVMELLEGEDVSTRLSRSPELRITELLTIVDGVLGGLAAVHDAGVIHRDLKPQNIFLVEDADGVYPKIVDFGISHTTGRWAEERDLTKSGQIVGTPMYMAPEQARGQELDPRADLFAVGVILYEALSGRHPFMAGSLADLLVAIITHEPEPIAELRAEVGKPLSDIVSRAMSKGLAERFPDARAMRDALRGVTQEGLLDSVRASVVPAFAATLPATPSLNTPIAARPTPSPGGDSSISLPTSRASWKAWTVVGAAAVLAAMAALIVLEPGDTAPQSQDDAIQNADVEIDEPRATPDEGTGIASNEAPSNDAGVAEDEAEPASSPGEAASETRQKRPRTSPPRGLAPGELTDDPGF